MAGREMGDLPSQGGRGVLTKGGWRVRITGELNVVDCYNVVVVSESTLIGEFFTWMNAVELVVGGMMSCDLD